MGEECHKDNNFVHDSIGSRMQMQVEAAREKNRSAAMREASMALAVSMQQPVAKKRAGLKDLLRPFAFSAAVVREHREAQFCDYLSRQANLPIYAKCSTLESLVLLHARSKMWGIKAVMIDYAEAGTSEGPNWRIIGFTNGMADRGAAWLVIQAAAHEYAMWVMVDDADPAAGQLVTPSP